MAFYLTLTLNLLTCICCLAQQSYVFSGFVRDASSGESLIGAAVAVEGTNLSTKTNSYGFYSLLVPINKQRLVFSYVGYADQELNIDLFEDTAYNIELLEKKNVLEEIVVAAERRDKNIRDPLMGVIQLGMEEVKNVPVLFGEKDLLKTIQLLPGVQSGGEGTSNFYVRGGGADQNLILLDEATVYNASHLLGFFSTFNSDAIKDVQLYKGGIPAQFGGRISSVLDIVMLDGNQKKRVVEGGIGLISSRLKIEAPIIPDKSSFMLSARRTYADMFLKLSKDSDVNSSKLYFYDINAKANYRFNEKNRIFVSAYFGKDDLGYADRFSFDWGNKTATVRWNRILNQRLFSNSSLIYSDFKYNVNVSNDNNDFRIMSNIRNWSLKQDFTYYKNTQHTVRFGANILHQYIRPTSLNAQENSALNTIEVGSLQGIDLAGYISHEWKPIDGLSFLYGARISSFLVMGPGTFYTYDKNRELLSENSYTSEIVKQYFNVEPRFSASLVLNTRSSVKASYNRIAQNLHQLSNTTSSLPTDQYVISSINIKPQIANQVAIGYFRNFYDNAYEFSVESYYKAMANQIDFKNGADLQANQYLEAELLFGRGRAYGLEGYIKKNSGVLTGWLSYTLSKSQRQFDDINQGNWFRARQDRTHDISVVGMYKLSAKWQFGATFIFNTGTAVTFPSGKYELDGQAKFYYTERNGYRMPNYHRLDISATYEPKRPNKKLVSSWTFGLYNAYNRKNAYLIDFRENESDKNITEAYRVALFGAIPSVTWNFKF